MEKLLVKLHSSIENRIDCGSLVSNIEAIALAATKPVDVEFIASLLFTTTSPPNLLSFLKGSSTSNEQETVKAQKDALRLLAQFIKINPSMVNKTGQEIFHTLLTLFKENPTGEIKRYLLLPAKNILRNISLVETESFDLRLEGTYNTLLDLQQSQHEGLHCEILKTLGLLVFAFPVHPATIQAIPVIFGICDNVLKLNFSDTCNVPDFSVIAGAFSCLDRCLVHHKEKYTNNTELWKFLLLAVKATSSDTSRYSACNKAVRLISHHAELFGSQIGHNAGTSYNLLYTMHSAGRKSMLKHSSNALYTVLAQIAVYVVNNHTSSDNSVSAVDTTDAVRTVERLYTEYMITIRKDTPVTTTNTTNNTTTNTSDSTTQQEGLMHAVQGLAAIAPAVVALFTHNNSNISTSTSSTSTGASLAVNSADVTGSSPSVTSTVLSIIESAQRYNRSVESAAAGTPTDLIIPDTLEDKRAGRAATPDNTASLETVTVQHTKLLFLAAVTSIICTVSARTTSTTGTALLLTPVIAQFLQEFVVGSVVSYGRFSSQQQELVCITLRALCHALVRLPHAYASVDSAISSAPSSPATPSSATVDPATLCASLLHAISSSLLQRSAPRTNKEAPNPAPAPPPLHSQQAEDRLSHCYIDLWCELLSKENAKEKTAATSSEGVDTPDRRHQALVEFSATQAALARETYTLADEAVTKAEATANMMDVLHHSMKQANKAFAVDLLRAQDEANRMAALDKKVEELHTRASGAFGKVQEIALVVETAFKETLSAIATADNEYSAARVPLEMEIQEISSKNANVEDRMTASGYSDAAKAAERMRIADEHAQLLSSLEDLSTQRLFSARELLESVRSMSEPSNVAQEAALILECSTEASEALHVHCDLEVWFSAAEQRATQAKAAALPYSPRASQAVTSEELSARAAQELATSLATQLDACLLSLDWAAAECAKYHYELPPKEVKTVVSLLNASVVLQRSKVASKKVLESLQRVGTVSSEILQCADQFSGYFATAVNAHAVCTNTTARIYSCSQEASQFAQKLEKTSTECTAAAEQAVVALESQAADDTDSALVATDLQESRRSKFLKRNHRNSLGAFVGGQSLTTSLIYSPQNDDEVAWASPGVDAEGRGKLRAQAASSHAIVSGTPTSPGGIYTGRKIFVPLSKEKQAEQRQLRRKVEELLVPAREAELRAEEATSKVERIAMALESKVSAAEEATSAAEVAAVTLDGELTAMTEFRTRADAVSSKAHSALLATSLAANVLNELQQTSSADIQAADNAHNTALLSIQEEMRELDVRMAEAEEQWQAVGASKAVRAAQRAVFAQNSSEIMERMHAASLRREQSAIAHVAAIRTQTENTAVQEKAAVTAEAATAAQDLRDNFRTTEVAISVAQWASQEAEKVNVAANEAAEARTEFTCALSDWEIAVAEAASAAEAAQLVIGQYEELGHEYPEHGVHSDENVESRAERCMEASDSVHATAEKLIALQGSAHSSSQHAASKCGQTVAARAVGYIALARASEAGQEAAQTASKAMEVELRVVAEAEDALTRCQTDAESSKQGMDDARNAAVDAEQLRISIEQAEIAERERIAAEILLGEQRAAHGKAKLLLDAAHAAETSAEEFTSTADRIAYDLEQMLITAQEAASIVEAAHKSISQGSVELQRYAAKSVELNNTVNDALFRCSLLANVTRQFEMDSTAYITETDQLFAAEHLAIENEAIQLDYALEAAEDRWHSEDLSSLQRAAERLPMAVQGAKLMKLMHRAALRKQEKIGEIVSEVNAHAEAAEAQSKVAGVSVAASEASTLVQNSHNLSEAASTASADCQQAAERSRVAALKTSEAKVDVRTAVEGATRAALKCAELTAATKVAIEECEKVGAERLTLSVNSAENVARRNQVRAEAVRRVNQVADEVVTLNESTQTECAEVTKAVGQLITSCTEVDENVAHILTSNKQVALEATEASQAHANAVNTSEAAAARAKSDVKTSKQAAEESLFAVADAESILFEEQTAHDLKLQAEHRIKQQAAQKHAKKLLTATKVTESEAEKAVQELERISLSLDQAILSAQEAFSTVKSSRLFVDGELVACQAYSQQAEELSAVTENALLNATLEANVSVENSEAFAVRIREADDAVSTESAQIDATLDAIEVKLSEEELQWETNNVPETARAMHRVTFAQESAALKSKLFMATSRRREQAAEHVSRAKALTEAADADKQASAACAAAASSQTLKTQIWSSHGMANAGQVSSQSEQKASSAAQRAVGVQAELHLAEDTANKTAELHAKAELAAKEAANACIELGAEAPAMDSSSQDRVADRAARSAEHVRRVHESADQIVSVNELVKVTTAETTVQWGRAVAARAVGDMAVAHAVENADSTAAAAARTHSVESSVLVGAEEALLRSQSDEKSASEAVVVARSKTALTERAVTAAQDAEDTRLMERAAEEARVEAEALRAKQEAARIEALELLAATKAAEFHAEELSFETERVALSLEQTVLSAEEAAATTTKSVTVINDELTVMVGFVEQTKTYTQTVNSALSTATMLTDFCSELSRGSTERINHADEIYAGEHRTFEREAIHLHNAVEVYEEQWERDNTPHTERAAQRVALALENAGLMLELFDAAVSRQHKAVEHVTLARSYTEPAEAQEQAATASVAATEASAIQNKTRSLDTANGAVKTTKLAAEKVSGAVKVGGEVLVDIQDRLNSMIAAETSAVQSAEQAKNAIAACAELGADAPPFNLNKHEDVKRRADRCADAKRRVEACIARLSSLHTTTAQSMQTVSGKYDQVAFTRASGVSNVAHIVDTAEKVHKQAAIASAIQTEMIDFAEEALARSRTEAASCSEMEEKSRVSAEESDRSRVALEVADAERVAAEAVEQARIQAEILSSKRLAAQNRVDELIKSLQQAENTANELSFRPETLAAELDEIVQMAEEATVIAKDAIAPAHADWTTVEDFRTRAEDIKSTAENALLAATMEATLVEENSQALYQRISTADSAFYSERTSIDSELRAFDHGVEETEHKWECELNVLESHKLTKRAMYAHDREGLVAKRVAVVTRREEQAMDHVVVAGGFTEVGEAQAMAVIAQNAALAAYNLQMHTEFQNDAVKCTEVSTQAAGRVSALADQAVLIGENVGAAAVEAATANQLAMETAAELKKAMEACKQIGANCPTYEPLDAGMWDQREQRYLEAVRQVEDIVERVQELHEAAQGAAKRTRNIADETTTAKASGVQSVVLSEEASQKASQQAARARAIEVQLIADAEAALTRARTEAKPARQAVIDARNVAAEAERARLAGDDVDAQKVASDMLRSARTAADARMEKQRAAVVKAKALIDAAESADGAAEERVLNVERIAATLTATHVELVETAKQVTTPTESVRECVASMTEYKSQAEVIFNVADQARLVASVKAAACDENRLQSQSRIQRSDETYAVDRAKLIEELARFDASVLEAEARWEAEEASQTVRTSHRAVFAKDKARLVSQISAAAAKRAVLASQHVALLQQRHEADFALEKAQVAAEAVSQANQLQASVRSTEHISSAAETSTQIAKTADESTLHAIEAEGTFRSAMLEATKASKLVIQASSAAKSSILDCQATGADTPKYVAPSAEVLTRRTQRCTEATQRVHDQEDIIKVLNMSIQKSALLICNQCGLVLSAREDGDRFVSRTAEASAEAAVEASRAGEIERSMLEEAEASLTQARAEAKIASEEGKAAHLAAVHAAQAHTVEVESSGSITLPVRSEQPFARSPTSTKAETVSLSTVSHTSVEPEQDILHAAQEAITRADEWALKAERSAFALEHTVLAAEDVVMTAKGAVGVVHGELVYMEAYRSDAEKLNTAAENASRAASLEANVSAEHSQASSERIKLADDSLAAERALYDAGLRVLSDKVASAEALWESKNTSETIRATQKASFARELADLLNKLSVAVVLREQKASDHLNFIKSHSEAVDAQKKANTASTAATTATNLFNETRSTEQASRVSLTGCRASEKTPEMCKQATEAREEVRIAVAKSLKYAELYEQITRKATDETDFPQYDLSRRAQRCADALLRVDERATQVMSLSETVRQSAVQATAECGQAVAARAVGDLAVKQTQEHAQEAVVFATTAASTASAMVAAADSSLSWARIQAKSTSSEAQAAETEANTLQSSIARVNMSQQDAAVSTVNDLLCSARDAAAVADEKILEVERIAATLEAVVFSAEEASMMSKGAVGVVHGELVYMEAYKKVAEDIAAQAEQDLPTNSPKSRLNSEESETSALLIRSADESYATERAALEKKIRVLADTTAAAELRWRAEEEPEVNRVTQRASFAQARSRFLEKLSVAAAEREKVAMEHVAMARAHCEAASFGSESISMKSTAASVASDLQSDTRNADNALSASRAGHSASERAKAAATKAEQIEKDIITAADGAKSAVEKYLLAEKAAKAAIAKYTESGVAVPAYEKSLSEEVCLRSERRVQAVKRVTESADYVVMLNDSAQLSYQQASSQCADAVQARARGDRAIARVVNPTTATGLETVALAEAALVRCQAESRLTDEAFQEAKVAASGLRKTKVGLQSMASRSNLGLFLKQEFGETESHLVTGAVSLLPFKNSPVVMSRKSMTGPSETDDPNAGSNVDHTYIQSPQKEKGKHHAVIPEIWSLQGEALTKYRATQEAERIKLAHQSAPIEETKMYEVKRLQAKKQSFRVKELRKRQSSSAEDMLAQELEDSIEQISSQVEEALFAAELDVTTIEESGCALRDQLTWMEEFKSNANSLNDAAEKAFQSGKLLVSVAKDNAEQSLHSIKQADNVYHSERSVLESQLLSVEHDFSGVQRESLVDKLLTATEKRLLRATQQVSTVRTLLDASGANDLNDAASRNAEYAQKMRAWYTHEHMHAAHNACDAAMTRVTQSKSTIESQIAQAEAMIAAVLAMCSISAAKEPKSAEKKRTRSHSRDKHHHNVSMSSILSENTLSSLSDGDLDDGEDVESSFVRNANDTARVLQLALERMRIANTRATKLHENATSAFTQAESAHRNANIAVLEAIKLSNETFDSAQEAGVMESETLRNVELTAEKMQVALRGVEQQLAQARSELASTSLDSHLSAQHRVLVPASCETKDSSEDGKESDSEGEKEEENKTTVIGSELDHRAQPHTPSRGADSGVVDSEKESPDDKSSVRSASHSVYSVHSAHSEAVAEPHTDTDSVVSTTSNTPLKQKKRLSLMGNVLGVFSGKKDKANKQETPSSTPVKGGSSTLAVTPVRK